MKEEAGERKLTDEEIIKKLQPDYQLIRYDPLKHKCVFASKFLKDHYIVFDLKSNKIFAKMKSADLTWEEVSACELDS